MGRIPESVGDVAATSTPDTSLHLPLPLNLDLFQFTSVVLGAQEHKPRLPPSRGMARFCTRLR